MKDLLYLLFIICMILLFTSIFIFTISGTILIMWNVHWLAGIIISTFWTGAIAIIIHNIIDDYDNYKHNNIKNK